MDNALKFLEHLDPNLPYFISDHIWFPQRRVAGGCCSLCATQGMSGSHCMAGHACCCPLQLIWVPCLNDGLSASHLLPATIKEPACPLASLSACLLRGCLQCAGAVPSALWLPAKAACQHIMVACSS